MENKDKHGQGTFTWSNGDKYVGEYRDDKKHGQGTYTFGPKSEWSGDKYVGEYKDGKKNGQGTYTWADDTVEEGIWKDGEFQYAKKLSPPVPVAKTPTQDDDEPETLSYQMTLFGPIGSDVKQDTQFCAARLCFDPRPE